MCDMVPLMAQGATVEVEGISAIEDLTPGWMEAVLHGAGLPMARVSDVTVERVGTGQSGTCCRIVPQYVGSDPALPRSIIAKFPGESEASRRIGTEYGVFLREVNFYRYLQHRCAIRTPRCYHASIRGNGPEFAILLEDLAPAVQGDQMVGCSIELTKAALVELVGLHAPTWHDAAILEQGWMMEPALADRAECVSGLYRHGLPQFMERCAPGLEPDEVALIKRLGKEAEFPSEYPRLKVHCATHNDYRLDNLLIDSTRQPERLHVVDWQTVGTANPMRDVSYFLGGCLTTSDRAALERELVGYYHDHLIAAGVADYPLEQCWDDYRQAAYHGLMNAVVAMIGVGRTERGDRLFTLMAQRHVRQILDLGADTLLG